jgi:hypothetical protein
MSKGWLKRVRFPEYNNTVTDDVLPDDSGTLATGRASAACKDKHYAHPLCLYIAQLSFTT